MSEFELAFVIEDTFDLPYGLVVISGPNCLWDPQMKQTILLKMPDGSERMTTATAIFGSPNPEKIISLNLKELSIAQVPKGTEVWVKKR